jgi:hypothetical protein
MTKEGGKERREVDPIGGGRGSSLSVGGCMSFMPYLADRRHREKLVVRENRAVVTLFSSH